MSGQGQSSCLLNKPLIHSSISEEKVEAIASEGKNGMLHRKIVIVEEVKKQVWLAGPMMCVGLLQVFLQSITIMFVGHLGELALSGASIASSFASVSGFNFLVGMSYALDTLCGQAFGAKQYHMLGIHLQRAMLIVIITCIPFAILCANAGTILQALGQDPAISKEAGRYALYMIPSIFGYGLLQCLFRFLQTQNNVFPLMISAGFTMLLHVFLCWALVLKSGIGSRGGALANAISYWTNLVALSLYVKFSPKCAKTWNGFSKEALHDMLPFLKLAILSAGMVCLEMWSYELLVLFSGLLPNPQLETSVISISLNTALTVWVITYGLAAAVSTRVSNELGAGRPQAARLAVSVVLVLSVTQGILVALILILIRNTLGYAYSSDEEVVKTTATLMPLLGVPILMGGLQSVLSGAYRGCGWQKIGALINFGSYYVVGTPCGILLAFILHLGGKGLWLGITSAMLVQAFFLFIITIRTNWDDEARKARERVYNSTIPAETVS